MPHLLHLLLLALACQAGAADPAAAAPVVAPSPLPTPEPPMAPVTRHDQIAALDGQTATVVGTYTQVDVRRRHPRDTRPPEYTGHVALVLEDGRKVHLEPIWADAGTRPQAERDRWDGQTVAVTGTLHATMPEPEIPVATLTTATLTDITAIEGR